MSHEFEVFTECPDYPDLFWIGDKGTLFSLRSFRDVSLTESQNGYLTHATKIGGRKGKDILVRAHVQVAKAFIANPENKPFVNHKDGNKRNNAKDNLEWVTHQENMIHARLLGLIQTPSGWNHPSAKLNEDTVAKLMSQMGKTTIRAAAKEFGINKETVRRLWNGTTYVVH